MINKCEADVYDCWKMHREVEGGTVYNIGSAVVGGGLLGPGALNEILLKAP